MKFRDVLTKGHFCGLVYHDKDECDRKKIVLLQIVVSLWLFASTHKLTKYL